MCNLDMYFPGRSKWLLILNLGGDGGGDSEDLDAAGAAAAAGGEGRGGAERDVVEAERHPGGHRGEPLAQSAAAKEPGAAAGGAPRNRDWDVGGGGGKSEGETNGGARDGLPPRAISTSGLGFAEGRREPRVARVYCIMRLQGPLSTLLPTN